MKKNTFFAMLARMKHIHRWGLMRSTLPESLSEHSHETAMLAHALAVIERDVFGGCADPARAAELALYHDATEVLTGDLPTPVKYHHAALRTEYAAVEREAADRLLAALPEAMRPAYAPLLREEGPERELVKAADKLSAWIKCIEERQMGNCDFARAEKSLRTAVVAMHLRAADYFVAQFLPAYTLTLDEQQADD